MQLTYNSQAIQGINMHMKKMSSLKYLVLLLFCIPFVLGANDSNNRENMNHLDKNVLIIGASGLYNAFQLLGNF